MDCEGGVGPRRIISGFLLFVWIGFGLHCTEVIEDEVEERKSKDLRVNTHSITFLHGDKL